MRENSCNNRRINVRRSILCRLQRSNINGPQDPARMCQYGTTVVSLMFISGVSWPDQDRQQHSLFLLWLAGYQDWLESKDKTWIYFRHCLQDTISRVANSQVPLGFRDPAHSIIQLPLPLKTGCGNSTQVFSFMPAMLGYSQARGTVNRSVCPP